MSTDGPSSTISPPHSRSARLRWFLPDALRPLMLDGERPRLQEWLEQGRASIVKKGPHRVVYRVELEDRCVYIKHNLAADWRTWLRACIRRSKASLEFEVGRALAERGIGTVLPLGYGEPTTRFGTGESFLITAELQHTETLQQYLISQVAPLTGIEQARARQTLATTLGDWIARLHHAGVRHNDFHAGNILVRDSGEQLELFLIDLNAVRLSGPLSWQECRENLIMLNRWFSLRSSRCDRMRFAQAYLRRREEAGPSGVAGDQSLKAMADEIEEATLRSNIGFWRDRDERCLERNRYYRKVHINRTCGHHVTELDPDEIRGLMANPDAPFLAEQRKLLKDSRSSTVAEMELTIGGVRRTVIYKRFRLTTWHDPFRSLLRPTEALRSWFFGQGLCERGIPTPRPLAVFHKTRLGMRREGYLITEKIDDSINLVEAIRESESLAVPEAVSHRRHLITRTAGTLRMLHGCLLSHRDLKATNILVTRKPRPLTHPGGPSVLALMPHLPSRIWLIDLVGMERHTRRLPQHTRLKNLARLNVSFLNVACISRTERLRFLREYMQWGVHGNDGWKTLWRAIEQITCRKVARNKRIGRVLA